MMEIREVIERAAKTFIQTFIAYIIVTIPTAFDGVVDDETLINALVGLGAAAIGAAISAVWNGLTPAKQAPEETEESNEVQD